MFTTIALVMALQAPIEVDFTKVSGVIRPLNGVNGGPLVTRGAFDLNPYFKELGVADVRLHDVPWMYENAVDMNYLFPRFDLDENDPKNYDFTLTDHYMKSIMALDTVVMFRLGYSAEWPGHPPIHNAPPKDVKKWAAVSANIVRHYNKGWADGFKYGIQYWEIWNEPNIPNFWKGTPEEFAVLYEATAKAIKEADPSIKIGGPSVAGYTPFLDVLLKHCAATKAPVDFVSWHRYATHPREVLAEGANVHQCMEKYGFGKAESILGEWNYLPYCDWGRQEKDAQYRQELMGREMGGVPGASYAAAALTAFQDTRIDRAQFYQASNMFWGGLFDGYGVPNKTYYALKAFRHLLDTPERAGVTGSSIDGVAVLAGMSKDKKTATIMISNFGTKIGKYELTIRGLPEGCAWERQAIDGARNLDLVDKGTLDSGKLSGEMEIPSVCLIRLKAK